MSFKKILFRTLFILFWLILIIGTGVLLAFINQKHKETICRNVEINIDHSNENYFLTVADIKSLILQTGDSLKGQPLSKINLELVKNSILGNSFVRNVNIYATIEGDINIQVTQRRPIIRIFTEKNQSFYLDEKGMVMPLNKYYTARVLIATGKIRVDSLPAIAFEEKDSIRQKEYFQKSNLDSLFILAKTIDTSAFWKAQISQINVNEKKEIELIPQIGNHVILLGTIENLVEKFDKLYLFYKKELTNFGLTKYKVINLKFDNQLVCSKN